MPGRQPFSLQTAATLLVLETRMTLRILDEDRKFMLTRHQDRV